MNTKQHSMAMGRKHQKGKKLKHNKGKLRRPHLLSLPLRSPLLEVGPWGRSPNSPSFRVAAMLPRLVLRQNGLHRGVENRARHTRMRPCYRVEPTLAVRAHQHTLAAEKQLSHRHQENNFMHCNLLHGENSRPQTTKGLFVSQVNRSW